MAPPPPLPGLGRLILGSSSPTRRSILASMGFTDLYLRPAGIDENAIRFEDATKLVSALAHAKADAVLASLAADPAPPPPPTSDGAPVGATLLLTGDQVVVHAGRILEKPRNADDVRAYLAGYGSSPAVTVGSTVVTDVATGRRWEGADRAEVYFRPLPSAVVEGLIEEGAVFGCAGALMVEHALVGPFVECVVGEQSAVMGLSKTTTRGLIEAALSGEGGSLRKGSGTG